MRWRERVLAACVVAVCVSLSAAAEGREERERAVRLKTTRQLKELLDAHGVKYKPSADKETLRALVLNSDVPDEVLKPKKKGAAAGGVPGMERLGEALFMMQDKDRDGRLSREELQEMIDLMKQNPAMQGGPGTDGFFEMLDTDGDGGVDRKEADAFFKMMSSVSGAMGGMGGMGAGAGAKPKPKPNPAPEPDDDSDELPMQDEL